MKEEDPDQKTLSEIDDTVDSSLEDSPAEEKQEEQVKQKKEPTEKKRSNDFTEIHWEDFFDDGDQSEPSDVFWDLKGENVEISGWMGEVLNVGQGWFLLIPAPGAECPFCSADESFWNEIMIVFVEDQKELRYTGEPMLVKGRLDVGIKVDESNYKTMFRIYDATFENL